MSKKTPSPSTGPSSMVEEDVSLSFRQLWRLFFKNWRFVSILALLFGISVLGMLWHTTTLQSQLVRSTTLNNALLYSQALAEFRSLYTSEVVNTAKQFGLEVSHDYAQKDHAIPLPATMSILLGQKIGEHNAGAQARLYSPYPFPWRLQESSQRDAFSKDAWRFLKQNPQQPYFLYDDIEERPVLRYAIADLMRKECVDCHNSHPDSPKKDWREGEIRGVLEIILPIDASVAQARENLTGTFIILGILASLGVVVIGIVVGKLRQNAEALQYRVNERTQALETANRELAQQTVDLSRAKNIAEKATSSKSDFLARMSHEIRTPMNAIIGLSNLLLRGELNPRQQDYQLKVLESARHLLNIINDILDFSKIEAGKMELETTDFLLCHIIEQTANMFRVKAAEKHIELFYLTEADVPQSLQGDPLRISQVLINLLSNAIKFTEEGEIVVRVQLNKDTQAQQDDSLVSLLVTVKDSGTGMNVDTAQTLFQPFTQADGSISRKFGGTGLGLSICQRLVTQMGGEIWAESELGQGTTLFFTLNLPYGQHAAPMLLTAPPDIRGLKVLLVEDNDTARLLIEEMLFSLGFNVSVVASGKQALVALEQALVSDPFRLVITDWQMPTMDGLELSQHIHNHPQFRQGIMPKIILVTMYDRDELLQNAKGEHLFDGYLLKPISSSELFNVIMQCFDKEGSMVPRLELSPDTSKLLGLNKIKGAKILLVEDNYINQEVALAILNEADLVIDTAADGKKAVDILLADADSGRSSYEVVLMDVQMPIWDGYMATKIIRNDPRFSKLPIIAMTAHALKGDKEKCIAAGMNDYITKPIDEQELFTVLIKWLAHTPRTIDPSRQVPPASGPMEQWEGMPQSIPGLDLVTGLERVKGDSALFRRMLANFLESYGEADARATEYLQQGRQEEAKALVHTVKGVSGNLCANGLFHVSKQLDQALLEDNPSLIDEALADFSQALSVLVSSLRMLDLTETSPIAADKSTGVEDLQQIERVIKQLYSYLQQSNSRASHSMDELRVMLASADCQHALGELEKAIYAFDSDKALSVLFDLAKELKLNLQEDDL